MSWWSKSFKARVILLTLAVFLASIWLLAFELSRLQRKELEQHLGNQQFSTVSIVAAQIEQMLGTRFHALDELASQITPAMLDNEGALRVALLQRKLALSLFNGGVIAYRLDGTAVAEAPQATGRVGLNYMEIDTIAAALREGRSTVGAPVMGKVLGKPVFGMTVPIRDASGRVLGALAGVTNLGAPNFLDPIFDRGYGSTGGYLLVAAKQRLIVTATEKRRAMEILPPPGVNPGVDDNIKGFEGHRVLVNPLGVQLLGSVKQIPVAGWYLVTALPVAEAFAPLHAMQRHLVVSAAVLSVLFSVIVWLILRHQMAPMLSAMKTMSAASGLDQPPAFLPTARPDEIGELISGFNRLLAMVAERDTAVRQGHDNLRSILETTLDGYWEVDHAGRLLDVNPSYCRLSGYSRAELLSLSIPDLEAIESSSDVAVRIERIVASGRDQFESSHRRKDGSVWHVEVSVSYRAQRGERLFVFLRDITGRKLAEEAQRELLTVNVERAHLASIVESSLDSIASVDVNGVYTSWNKSSEAMFGYTAQEIIGRSIYEFFAPEQVQVEKARIERLVQGAGPESAEVERLHRDGQTMFLLLSVSAIHGAGGEVIGVSRVSRDISQLKQAHLKVQVALADKEALLKEVHHRVKNNLQVITSLLRLESRRSAHADTRRVLDEMTGRIRAMAMLHESLYRSETLATVDLGIYLQQLATQIFRAQATYGNPVRLQLDLASVQLDLDRATPCGLLINELISNSLKHAFPHERGGEIWVKAALLEQGTRVRLSVGDNGVGLPVGFDVRKSSSLGLQLVTDLAGQLGSSLQVEDGPGASFSVTFGLAACKSA